MRVALDARIAQSDRVGMGVYVSGLLRALVSTFPEHQFTAITSARLPALSLAAAPNLRILPVAPTYQQYVARDWWEQLRLPALLAEVGVDVYHAPNYTLPILRRTACATVLTLYDASLFEMPGVYRARHAVRVRWLIARSVERADGVVFGSRHAERAFARLFPHTLPAEHRAIYIGVPDDIVAPEGGTASGDASVLRRHGVTRSYAIAVGSVHPRKNYRRLVEAMTHPSLAGCQLVLAGGIAWKADDVVRAVDELGLRDRVVMTGFVETADLRVLLRNATMLVFPSLYEGFGIPPLEAFALGVPVCAAAATSIPEVVGDAGLLFDPLSSASIAEAMGRLLDDGVLRERLIAHGRQRLARFSWTRCAQDHMEVYHAAVERGAHRP